MSYLLYNNYIRFKQMMFFKANFIMSVIIDLIGLAVSLLFYQILYLRVDLSEFVPIWQVFLLVISVKTVNDLYDFFFASNINGIPYKIQYGSLDFDLIRPINIFQILLLDRFNIRVIINLLVDLFLLVVIISGYELQLSFIHYLNYLALISCAVLVRAAFSLIIIILSFKFTRVDSFIALFTSFFSLSVFPDVVYKSFYVRWFLTYIIPVIVIGNIPVRGLSKIDLTGNLLIILLTTVFLTAALYLLKINLKQYKSASS